MPALTPLTTNDADWRSLTGITLPARISFFKNGKKEAEKEGSFLFTHFGFSGPAALDISRFIASAGREEEPTLTADFLPSESEEATAKNLRNVCVSNPGKRLKNFLVDHYGLPLRFIEVFLRKN